MLSDDRPTEAIYPNEKNPRRSIDDPEFLGLVESIKSQGIIQPLLINDDGMILAGHRRFAAALDLGLQRVPVRVVPTNANHTLIPLIENLQRKDLEVLEVADYMLACRDEHGLTVPQIAEITGISTTTISQYLKLAQGPKEVRERVERDEITLGAAFALLGRDKEFIREVINEPNLTREVVRARAKAHKVTNTPRPYPVRQSDVSRRCPGELKPHIQYVMSMVREFLDAAPNDDFAVRYKRWLNILEDDWGDLFSDDVSPSFVGSISSMQRQPNTDLGWKAS